MVYMLTLEVYRWQMLPYIAYMGPMGTKTTSCRLWEWIPSMAKPQRRFTFHVALQNPPLKPPFSSKKTQISMFHCQ